MTCIRLGWMVLAALVLNAPVFSQPMPSLFPQPLSLYEARSLLERYASLEKSQWPLIEHAHDEYLAAFTLLREGPVQRYLDESQKSIAVLTGRMPEYAAIKKLIDNGALLNGRIAAVDDAFFQQLIPQLHEHQVPGIFRAKTARKRQRNFAVQMGLGPAHAAVDYHYWELARKFDLSPETRAIVDPDLRTFENAMATLTAERLTAARQSILKTMEAMSGAGLGDLTVEDMADQGRMEEVMEAVRLARSTSMAGLAEVQIKINQRNRSFARRLCQILSLEEAQDLMIRRTSHLGFLRGKGTLVFGVPEVNFAILLPKILASEELSQEEKETVELLIGNWRRRDLTHLEHLADEMDALMMLQFGDFNHGDPNEFESLYQPTLDINEARSIDGERLRASLEAMLGPERYAAFKIGEKTDEQFVVPMPGFASTEVSSAEELPSELSTDSSFGLGGMAVADALPASDLQFVAEILDLSKGEEDILRVVHSAYLTEWERHVAAPVQKAVRMNPWEMEEDAQRPTFNGDVRVQQTALLEEAFARSVVLDESLFRDVAAAMSGSDRSDRLASVKQYRLFQRLNEGEGASRGPFMSVGFIAVPDPFKLVLDLGLDTEQRFSVLSDLSAQHTKLALAVEGLEKQRFEAAKKALEVERSMFNAIDGETEQEGAIAIGMGSFQEQLNEATLAQQDTIRRVSLVKDVLENELGSDLDELTKLEMRVALVDQIVAEENRSLRVVRRVRGMPDLEAGQIESISVVVEEHLRKDIVFANQLSELILAPTDEDTGMEQAMQKAFAQQQKIDRIAFQRHELEIRLLDRMAALLTPLQRARIPSLSELNR